MLHSLHPLDLLAAPFAGRNSHGAEATQQPAGQQNVRLGLIPARRLAASRVEAGSFDACSALLPDTAEKDKGASVAAKAFVPPGVGLARQERGAARRSAKTATLICSYRY
jgi:hypothetical protein